MRFLPLALIALVAATACDDPTVPPPPAALDRPEAISFFCWDRNAGAPVPLERCTPVAPLDETDLDDDDAETGTGSNAGSPPEPFELHAVVTQTATGQVAAVQVTGDDADPPGVIDSDVRVPGFTFAPVGDVPSSVVTPASDPAHTYVVSRGSSAIHVIETASFRAGLGAKARAIPGPDGGPFFALGGARDAGGGTGILDGGIDDAGFGDMDGGLAADAGMPAVPVAGRPSDMVATPDERELVVAVPEAGEVWFLPIDGGEVGTPIRVPLTTVAPPPVDLTSVPAAEQPPIYELARASDGDPLPIVQPEPIPPRTPVANGTAPLPWKLAIDEENGRVLVSDRALPIIHVIDIATHAELAPINVSVPTRDVVITPRVPARFGDTVRTERFLYAIEDANNSVLAVDYSDPARSSFGAVLTVNLTAPQDRLAVPVPARAIEVVTPLYPEEGPLPACDPDTAAPNVMRGVFLAVATTDGLVRIFDIFDLDAPCRGMGANNCPVGSGAADEDDIVAIARHRPRIGFCIEEGVTIDPAPSWTIENLTATVSAQTGAADDLVSTLAPLTCPPGLGPVFGEPSTRICAVTDPFASTAQRFTATWQGPLPFTAMTGANFVAGEPILEVRFDPCELGVLGSENVPATGPLSTYAGDAVAITGPLPPATEDDARCQQILQETEAGETTPVLLPLVRASADGTREGYPGRLVVGEQALNVAASLDEIRACFPEQLRIEVRARGAFVVQSARRGFVNPVVRGEGGVCEVDPRAAATENGRAIPGELFRTEEIAFELEGVPLTEDVQLRFTTAQVPVPLGFDVSIGNTGDGNLPSLIAELEFNEVDQRLYVVEQARRGLLRLNLATGTIESPVFE